MFVNRMGALAIVERPAAKHEINRLLRQYDPTLSVEQQMRRGGELVWCVIKDCGILGVRTVYDYRDEDGTPIPMLSERIVDHFRRRENESLADLVARADAENARLVADRRARAQEGYETAASEMRKMVGRSAVLPRSQALRMSRDKARARGEKR
jgi:hypothetical protein